VSVQSSDTVPAGEMVSQSPVGGASVAPGSAVGLVVSSGASNRTPVLDPIGNRQVDEGQLLELTITARCR